MGTEGLKWLEEIGLRTSAFKVLCLLSFVDEPMKPQEIADRVSEKASTVRARLTEMKGLGLVSATPDGYLSNLRPYDMLMKLYREIKREVEG